MANFRLGQAVVNFGITCKVVGFFKAAGGPSEHDGHLILRQLRDGKLRGGKWVADPEKCEEAR